jgi:tripartite ATP-independent transporter DctP family solute receptor
LYCQKLLLLIMLMVWAGCAKDGRVQVIKLAHGLDPTHPVHKAMMFFAERLAEKSNGTIRVDIYPSEQLGSERECIELLQIGSLGMTKVSTSPMEGFVPVYKIFSLPYLFRSEEHRFLVLEGEIGKRLLLECEEFGLRGVCFYDAGSRSFYTKAKPVLQPEDLRGLKIRTQESATAMAMIHAMGGSATPIAWGELYSALQQGIVDGAENNPPSFYLSHHYEVAKYYSLDEHTAVPDVLLISTQVWAKFSQEQQQLIQEAADESAHYQKELWKEASQHALEEVQKAGVEITRPDKAPFQQAVQSLYEDYRSQPKIYDLIKQIGCVES